MKRCVATFAIAASLFAPVVYALIKKMLQNEQKLAKESAETNGWNVTEETTAVTDQFCAAVKGR